MTASAEKNEAADLATKENQLTHSSAVVLASETKAGRDEDRLLQQMDSQFKKFEDLITQIAASMGELRGEVNQIKGKPSDAH